LTAAEAHAQSLLGQKTAFEHQLRIVQAQFDAFKLLNPEKALLDSHVKTIIELNSANLSLESRLKQANDTSGTLRQAGSFLEERLNGANASARLLQEQRNDAQNEITRLDGEIRNLTARNNTLNGQIQNLNAQNNGLNGQIQNLNGQNTTLAQRVNRQREAYRNQIQRHSNLRAKLIFWGSLGAGIAAGMLAHKYRSNFSSYPKFMTLMAGACGWFSFWSLGHSYADSCLAADRQEYDQSGR
jgi:chromosome segregation ATPase